MSKHNILTGSEAAALAAAAARPEVITAYPITPQTGIIEKLSELKASGELLGCEFVTVESEHSALALLNGAGQGGARIFTATSSHGLLYMHEVTHWVAGARIPVVMVNANRAIGSPWNIACDRTDSLSQRDTGWGQIYVANNQEGYDSVLMAFLIAEKCGIPFMVNMDGFLLTHTKEPVTTESQESVDAFLPKHRIASALDVDDPHSVGASGTPQYYFDIKRSFANDRRRAGHTVAAAARLFKKHFGRSYSPVMSYRMDDAEIAIVVMGSTTRIVHSAVDRMREQGIKVGAVQLWLFRPFPERELRKALLGVKKLIALDVNQHDIIYDETRATMRDSNIPLWGFTVGVGGVPMNAELFCEMIRDVSGEEHPTVSHSVWRGVPKTPGVPVTFVKKVPEPIRGSSEFVNPGHRACAGCTASLVMRHLLDVVGKGAEVALPACCWSIIAGPNPYTPLRVPLVHCPFETAAATAAGMKRAAIALGKDITAIAFAGDGGTADIGFQALSGAAERGEDIIYICYDNEAYMNTGGQRSSSTPRGAVTETTPLLSPKRENKKRLLDIMAAHNVPYVATASIYHLDDFREKVKKALQYAGEGLRFIQVLAPCNPGWKIAPEDSLTMGHLAVETCAFPLVEVDHGKWRITYRPEERIALESYISAQGRFAHWTTADMALANETLLAYWEKLEKLEKYF